MAELRPHVATLRQIGVEPYVIGSGTPDQARAFQTQLEAHEVPILSDTALASYRAAGLQRSARATLSLKGARTYLKAVRAFRQGRTAGDPWQLGGAMIVRPSGEVTWRFASAHGGDHPSIDMLLAEARRAAA